MPFEVSFEGHDGVRMLAEQMLTGSPDIHFELERESACDGQYALEWVMSGTVNNQTFTMRGVSVGARSDDGRVRENRDYWDSKNFPL